MHVLRRFARWAVAACLPASAICLAFDRPAAPLPALIGLLGAFAVLVHAWRLAGGTALRPAIVWAGLAVALAGLSQVVALGEPSATGRPGAGQVVYLSTLAAFATLISVLNARMPGGGAWAILMAMLVVVFLVPWLEGSGLAREGDGWDRLRLTPPWTIFYGLIVLAGVTNYLPTRAGIAALAAGLGFIAEFVGLTGVGRSREVRGMIWTLVPLCWTAAILFADIASARPRPDRDRLDRLWSWFRDAWGVVWALRVLERFNRTAEAAGWAFRLTWQGVAPVPGGDAAAREIPEEAVRTLAGLLRRFATADRIEAVIRGEVPPDSAGPLVGSDALD